MADLVCRDLVEIVTDYIEERLSPEDRARFDEHVAACDGCSRYVEQMRRTIRLTGKLAEQDVAPDARRALLDAFREWRAGRTHT